SDEYRALYLANRAKNYDDFVTAFSHFSGPPQNYCYGDVEGNIALWIHGKFPIKWREQGKFILDGSNSRHEWQGFIPHDQNLHVKNPDRGFVSSANQHWADSTYPYYAYNENVEYYRGRRINERLREMENITVRDIQKLQNDNFNYIASENLSFMLDMLDSTEVTGKYRDYYNTLRSWDFFNDPDLIEPTVFELMQDRVRYLIWDETRIKDVSMNTPSIFRTFDLMRRVDSSQFYDIKETQKKETLQDLVQQSFTYAVDSAMSWEKIKGSPAKWYLFKNSNVTHMLRIPQFSTNQIRVGGNHNIVNAASGNHGPSYRMVVSLSNSGINAWVNFPGSQTGNVGNPKY
ncbi:MAG: penicillin acylase family protein, partial [Bacteroidota bacterium]